MQVSIKAKKENVQDIINYILETNKDVEFIIDVPEEKTTIKKLYSCDNILDWNFTSGLCSDSAIEKKSISSCSNLSEINKKENEVSDVKVILSAETSLNIDINNFRDLALFIMAWWNMTKEIEIDNVDLLLVSRYYKELQESAKSNSVTAINQLMIKTLLEFRYTSNISIAVTDVKDLLYKNNSELKNCNLVSEVTALLFKNKKEA